MQLPGFLLTETITVEPYTGVGPVYGSARTVRAHVQEGRKLVKAEGGYTAEVTSNVFIRPTLDVPAGSRLTVRGRAMTAVAVHVNIGLGLPVPEHLDMWCEVCEFMPATTITVRRGTPTVDEFGDRVDSTTVVAAGLPALLVETDETSYRPNDQRAGVVEQFTIRLRSTADIREGDRLADDRTGRVYVAQSVVYPFSAVGPATGADDVRVVARRVAATSLPNS